MMPDRNFPRLTPDNHRVTSPPTPEYNCVAWAARDTERWWQPGEFWPVAVPDDDCGIGILEEAFKSLGFEPCDHQDHEEGYEKIALFGSNTFYYTHAARQLPGGKWTSKLGKREDIEHDTPDVVAGGIYGEVLAIMKRSARSGP